MPGRRIFLVEEYSIVCFVVVLFVTAAFCYGSYCTFVSAGLLLCFVWVDASVARRKWTPWFMVLL